MRVFSVGVIGTGAIAQQMHLPVLSATPNVQVAWVADAVADRARRAGQAFGVPSIALPDSPDKLPACDAVLLAIPLGARETYYPVFAQRNTAVLVEKPFATTLAEHRRIAQQFAPHLIACGLMRRTYANTLLLQAIVREQWFGPLASLSIAEGGRAMRTGADKTYLDNRRVAGGGVLLDLGCHTLDLAMFITGATAHEIETQEIILDNDLDRKLTAAIQLRNINSQPTSSCRLDYCVSWLDHQPNNIKLHFPEVTVSAGTTPNAQVEVHDRAGRLRTKLQPTESAARTSYQAFYLEWQHFLKGLEEGRPSLVSAASCELTTTLIEDLYQRGAVPCLK